MSAPLRPLTLLALSLSLAALAGTPATPPPSSQQTLVLGQTMRASIAPGDVQDPDSDDATYYDFYRFSAQAGQRVRLQVESSELDLDIELERSGGGPSRFTSSSAGPRPGDDSTKHRTGRPGVLEVTLPAGGEWLVRVYNADEGRLGAYTIRVEQRPGSYPRPTLTPQVQPLTLGRVVRGELGGSDALDDDWDPYDVYRFEGRAGQKVRIAYAGAGGMTALLHRGSHEGPQVFVDEKDFGMTELEGESAVWFGHTLPADGTYAIIVKTNRGPDETNPYRLRVGDLHGGAVSEAQAAEQQGSEFGDLGAFSFGVARGAFGDTSYLSFSGMAHVGQQLSPTVGVGVGGAVSVQDLEEETFYGLLVGPTLRWGEADGLSLTLMAGPSLYAGTLPTPDTASLGVGGRADLCVLNMDGFCLGGYVAGQKHGGLDFNVQYGGSLGAQW